MASWVTRRTFPSLGILPLLVQLVHGATPQYSYEFNSVAITGGGYITGIIGHPTEPNLLYTRTDIGGAYRWSQVEDKWIPLTDFVSLNNSNLLGTESIALDPTDPNRVYLANGRYIEVPGQSAFFASDDLGATFKEYAAPFDMGSNDLGRNMGERLAVNPFSPNELWMGTRNAGLWKSTDRAQTWTNQTSFPNAFANGIGIVSVLFDPKNSGTIYVAASVPNGLYVTKDGGKTWTVVPGQPQSWDNVTILFDGYTPQSTAPQPSKIALASNGVLYITFSDAPGPYGVDYGAVFSYNTVSSKWTNITPGTSTVSPPMYTPQAWPPGGYCGLTLDPKDPNTLVVVSLDRDPGPALDSMYLSHDGGKSWKDVSQLSTPPGSGGYWGHPIAEAALSDGVAVPWLSFDWSKEWGGYGAPSPIKGLTKFGWWMSAVLIDPFDSDHIMYGTGATIWATNDLSAVDSNNAPKWYIQAEGIEETVPLALISPSGGAHLFSGLGDINGMRHDNFTDPQPMYGLPTFSNGQSLDWAGQVPTTVVRIGACGLTYPNGCGQGAYSTDGGTDWTMFPNCAPGVGNQTWNPGFIAMDASGKYVVWATELTAGGPYASTDLGNTWTLPTGLTANTGNIAADRVQPKTFYAFYNSTWYVSTTGGVSYTATPAASIGLPASTGAIPVVNFAKAGEIWLPLGADGLYHTTNFGASWTKLGTAGLEANFFSVGAPAPGVSTPSLYLWGTAGNTAPLNVDGLYRSDDNGASWARINDDNHQYGGPGIVLGDPRVYGRVYLGTEGRGIVYADIASKKCGPNVPGTGGI